MRLATFGFGATTVLLGLLLLVAGGMSTPSAWADGQSCAGDLGHAHGHLDFLKKVGDPATGPPSSPQGFGFVTFSTGEEAGDRFAGVLRIQDGSTSIFVAQDGECTRDGGDVLLVVSLQNIQTGEVAQLEARADSLEGPGTFPASITLAAPRDGIEIVGVLVLVFVR